MRLDTDPYLQRYATRVRGMAASEIRALFSVVSRPEVVSFAGGMPYTAALDFQAVEDVGLKRVFKAAISRATAVLCCCARPIVT